MVDYGLCDPLSPAERTYLDQKTVRSHSIAACSIVSFSRRHGMVVDRMKCSRKELFIFHVDVTDEQTAR
jgi:hypothetical protein